MKRLKQLAFVLLGAIILAVLYYAISPLFRNVKVDEAAPASVVEEEETEEDKPAAMVSESVPATVVGTTGHPASGTARIITADGKRYVRYEDFKTINGPDIYVYLAKDLEAKEFVNLGRVRATEGNINYEIPDEVDVKEYPYVLTWCQAFGVLFNSAKVQ
jgi:hypothetical protein